MGKVNWHSKGKIWENTNISKLHAFKIIWMKQKSMQFPKHGKSGFPQYRKNLGKHKHFKFMGLGEAEIHAIPKTWEK